MTCVVVPQGKAFEFQTGVFKGDDSFSVDRLVASCQPRVMPALTSAGRVLVPYFESPEDCVNDTLSTAKDPTRKRKKSGKKATSADATSSTPRDNSPVKSVSKHSAAKLQQVASQLRTGNKHVRGVPEIPLADSCYGSSMSAVSTVPRGPKAWAGPSYYSSPPPEHLPMPTSFLLDVQYSNNAGSLHNKLTP
ncbi:TPA: hypothetical protein ACH3X2_005729 [Trebouxia sp. C0005]